MVDGFRRIAGGEGGSTDREKLWEEAIYIQVDAEQLYLGLQIENHQSVRMD